MPDQPGPVRLLAWVVWMELLRRRAFAVLLILMGLFGLAAAAFRAVGIENPETATFLTNLGITFAWGLSHLLTLFLAAGQFPGEIETRTLYPVLARPVTRGQVLLAKVAACAGCGMFTHLVLFAMAWVSVPRMESFVLPTFAQMLLFQWLSIALVSCLAILLSLLVPRGVVVVLCLLLVFAGGPLGNLLLKLPGGTGALAAGWIPRFDQLNLTTRLTDGVGPMTAGPFLALAGHALLCFAACFALAGSRLHRRRL